MKEQKNLWNIAEIETELATKKREFLEAQGKEPIYEFKQGETKVTFDTSRPKPRIEISKFRKENTGKEEESLRVFVPIIVKNEKFDWSTSASFYHKQIVKAIKKGLVTITVIRAGEGKQTRYAIKELSEE